MSIQYLQVGGLELAVRGRLLRTARPREEWDTDIADPGALAAELRRLPGHPDLFSFMQRLPDSAPRFPAYYHEWDNVAAIPVTTYERWFSHQLHRNPRNKLKKAQKQGVEIRIVPFDDELIRGIKSIQDEVPVRQGRPYVHYRKDLAAVRAGYETYLDRATFIGAYWNGELIGFFKWVACGRFARVMGLLTKVRHRDLAPMNALIAKAVEVTAERRVPYLVYGRYDYGKVGSDSIVDFKFYNGFEHVLLPRYFVPLTPRGRLALALRLHNGIVERLPRGLVQRLRQAKVRYWERRYRADLDAALGKPKATAAL